MDRAILFALVLLSFSSLTCAGAQIPTEPPWLCDKLASYPPGKQGFKDLRPNEVQQRALQHLLYALVLHSKDIFQQVKFVQEQNQRIHVCIPARGDKVPAKEVVLETDGHVFERSGNVTKFLTDPAEPVNALAGCARLVTECVRTSPSKDTLDQCVATAKVCPQGFATASTAPCCPDACRKRYQEERQRGTNDMDAFERVLFGESSCVPGVGESMRGK